MDNKTDNVGEHVVPSSHRKAWKLKRIRVRNIIFNTISITLVLGGISWALFYFGRYYSYEITNDAVIDQYVTPLSIRVSGYIREIRFSEHQPVYAGDTLLLLDDREFRIKLTDAEAALLDAQAAARVLDLNVRTSKDYIAVADANIAETKAKLWKLEQDEKRYSALLVEASVSGQQYEQVKAECQAMQARYEALIQQKRLAQSQAAEVEAKTGNGRAAILRREADLEMARLNLSYTVVIAPYDGFMGRRTLESGQLVQAGQTLSNIIRSSDKWVTANYKETQIASIYIGQKVNVKVDALRGKIYHGVVTAISEATGSKYSLIPTDNSAGNFVKIQQRIPVRIEFENLSDADREKLRAGMMVETEALLR